VITFSTKAQTLDNLYQQLKQAQVLPVFRFSVDAYKRNASEITAGIKQKIKCDNVIIRSSAFNEDGFNKSNAGHYRSVLNIPLDDHKTICLGIDEVIASYDNPDSRDEVFVQPMLQELISCGVAFTADMDTLAPYYIINYDESGRTDTITSGTTGSFKTFIQLKDTPVSARYPQMARLIKALQEIEIIFGNDKLDIEFAFAGNNQLYILQVRPISVENKEDLSGLNIKDALFKVYRKVEKLTDFHPNLLGHRTVFGVMPDWNPAEIIGLKPKQLSISLYKELVTDNIWAFQRDNYGYRNLRSHPLLVSFLGIPFIDVRVDFNSFIPKKLNEEIAKKLTAFYIDKLIKTPSYHDKVEFEIVHSCSYFNIHDRLNGLSDFDFTKKEIKQIEIALLELTNQVIDPVAGVYKKDIEKIEQLKLKHDEIVNSDLPVIDKIYWLIENCKRYGTLPFAGIARAAFIATQLLRSMVDVCIITKDDYNNFVNSLSTITSNLHQDLHLHGLGKLKREDFFKKYGHLRPGTYDILSLRYDENFENYFSTLPEFKIDEQVFAFTKEQIILIEKYLKDLGLSMDANALLSFIKESIEEREYSKYIFTSSLSKVLQLMEELGKKVNISREDMAFVDIKTVMNLYAVLDHRYLSEILEQDIAKNKEFYNYTKAIKLPSLIVDAEDVYGFYLLTEEPNFITLKKVQSNIIQEHEFKQIDPEGKIVFIKSADPGYDFLFTKNIAGLVTQFGGANSHMAVRCAELGIPAVIGAGEKNFNEWKNAGIIELDCSNKQIRIIR
jgi:phosphohistidine swiveling domain-containing protein